MAKKKTARKKSEMNGHVLGSVYVTLHQLITELYSNDTITERQHDHLFDLMGGGKKAIACSKVGG